MRTVAVIACVLSSLVWNSPVRAQEGSNAPAYKTVEADEFQKTIEDAKPGQYVILDVRTPQEYRSAHLKDSVLIDYKSKDFDQKIKELDKSKTYFVYCASGYRSSSACRKLQALDIPHLYNLKGGITAWQKAGKPTEKKEE